MMVRRSGRYTVNWRGFKDALGNKPPDDERSRERRFITRATTNLTTSSNPGNLITAVANSVVSSNSGTIRVTTRFLTDFLAEAEVDAEVKKFASADAEVNGVQGKEKQEPKPEEDLSNHDVIFLKSIVESPDFGRKYESIESEEDLIVKPVSLDNVNIIRSLSEYRGNNIRTIEQAELAILLSRVHFRALIDAHDQIGAIWLERGSGIDEKTVKEESTDLAAGLEDTPEQNGDMPVETIKVVGLRKVPGQPLGLTVTTDEHGQLIVARILAGSAAAKQALLSVGDVLLEVDGVQIDSEDQLKEAVSKPNDRVTLKVGPNMKDKSSQATNKLSCYMRALFDYNPSEDTLLPCKEIGLEFKRGDILQVSDRKDPNWWQASHVENPEVVGLIPSPELEERRKAYVPPEADFVHKISICGARISKKKKKFVYESRSSVQLEGAELALYEEVARTPPFLRRTLALVGTRGVGRRTLKNRLIQEHPERFGAVVPHTSRPPRPLEENGMSYWFVSREEMERDALAGRFLEHGEHNGHLYGTHLDSIRAVIKEGKMCILDCAPQSLKLLHNSSEFLPYVIMIGAPGIEQLRNLTYASNRNLTFDRQSSIRYSSRRARTLESLASLYEEEDMKQTLEESARIQRQYEKYIDLVLVNSNADATYARVQDALHALATDHQWVPVSWIY